jgi:DNA-binding IclR family transcriptional regulator
MRLRDIAITLGVTERTAYGLVTDLALTGYLLRTRIGRRNHYSIQAHELRLEASKERTIGEVLEFLNGYVPPEGNF